jgi:hypothetical protein
MSDPVRIEYDRDIAIITADNPLFHSPSAQAFRPHSSRPASRIAGPSC